MPKVILGPEELGGVAKGADYNKYVRPIIRAEARYNKRKSKRNTKR